MRVLLIEDDRELAPVIVAGLRDHGVDAVAAASFQDGIMKAALCQYAVILLDIMIPGGSGLDLCRRLRASGDATPILMLTARGAVEDRVAGLEAGADDYLPKPFAFQELLARVHALARRQPALQERTLELADMRVDFRKREVARGGKPIALTAKEWELFEVLAHNHGVVLTRQQITERVWDENHDPFTNVLEVLVRRLRRKIDDGHEPKLIQTVRGAGYRLGP